MEDSSRNDPKMPSFANTYFDRIICINLASRPDRWAECVSQFKDFDLTAQRFDAVAWLPPLEGCYLSHWYALRLASEFNRCLILEDDFEIIHFDFGSRLRALVQEVKSLPPYDVLYLGGNYRSPDFTQVSAGVRRTQGMATTSSYAVTGNFARRLLELPICADAIDVMIASTAPTSVHYIAYPRLIRQRAGISDLERGMVDYRKKMTDLL